MDFNELSGFLKDNIPFILIPVLFIGLMFLKPFRKFIVYCAKNITALALFAAICFCCSFFGYTAISLNVFSSAAALLLGIPGIILALIISLVI